MDRIKQQYHGKGPFNNFNVSQKRKLMAKGDGRVRGPGHTFDRFWEVSFYAFLGGRGGGGGGLEKFAMSFLFWETLNLLNGP